MLSLDKDDVSGEEEISSPELLFFYLLFKRKKSMLIHLSLPFYPYLERKSLMKNDK